MPVRPYVEQSSRGYESQYQEDEQPQGRGQSSRGSYSEPVVAQPPETLDEAMARLAPGALNRTLGSVSTFDKICHVVGKVLAELGKLAFIVGLGTFIAAGAGLFVLPALALQLAIGGGISLLAGEIIKNIATKPAADLTMNHTFSI